MYQYWLVRIVLMLHSLAHASIASNEIDPNHLKAYPFCGRMPRYDDSSAASSRVANSRDSDRRYPWVLYLKRNNLRRVGNILAPSSCTASIITSRYVKMVNNAVTMTALFAKNMYCIAKKLKLIII